MKTLSKLQPVFTPIKCSSKTIFAELEHCVFLKIFKDWTFASDSYLLFGANWEVIACSVTEMVTEHVIIVIVSLALPFSSNINPKMQQHCCNLLVFFLCFCLQSSFLGIFNRMLLSFPLFFTLHTLLVPAIAQVEFNDKWSLGASLMQKADLILNAWFTAVVTVSEGSYG